MGVSVSLCYFHVPVCSAHRGQKRALDSLELELHVVVSYQMWLLGTELVSSGRAARAQLPSITQLNSE